MPFAYPLFLSLEGEHCLVVGLGEVGMRKLAGLLACGVGSVLALDTRPPRTSWEDASGADGARLMADARVRLECRACTPADIRASRLVFAATGDAHENARIAGLCREARVPCNCASAPELGSFAVPAMARSGELCAALSTGGASPALARRMRRELEDWLAPHAALACFLGRLRPLVLAMGNDSRHNRELFRKVAASPLGAWLAAGDHARCRDWLAAELPSPLAMHAIPLVAACAETSLMRKPVSHTVTDGESHEPC